MLVRDLVEHAMLVYVGDSSAGVRIEMNGIVGDLLVTEAYAVPATDDGEYPAALHLVVEAPKTAHALHQHTINCVANGSNCNPGDPC
jgi:hypothetical protein